MLPVDSLKFNDSQQYTDRLKAARSDTGEDGRAGRHARHDQDACRWSLAAFEFDFMGGSMGSVVGERFVRGVAGLPSSSGMPFVCITASGGARMQEGVLSLMQMAKTSRGAARSSRRERLPFISILTDPTMGGVSASFALSATSCIAEPGALIGFAGPRVIEQTVREKLPEGFQRAEFLLEHGAIDMIVDRRQMPAKLAHLLTLLLRMPAAA